MMITNGMGQMNKRNFRDRFFVIVDEHYANEKTKMTMIEKKNLFEKSFDKLVRLSWELIDSIKNTEPERDNY